MFTVALASWWLIFGLSQARHLGALEGPDAAQVGRVTRMLVWEGVMLVAMLMAGGAALLVAIGREQRRRRELRAFFMAFTHDLKTSLSSLRLQAEALREDLPAAAAQSQSPAVAQGLGPAATAVGERAGAGDGRCRRLHRTHSCRLAD